MIYLIGIALLLASWWAAYEIGRATHPRDTKQIVELEQALLRSIHGHKKGQH